MNKYEVELKYALQAIAAAGAVLKANFRQKYRIIRKSPKEMVSVVDMESQKAILEVLEPQFPGYGIITEERSNTINRESWNWIIDPLDGTHNFISGLPFSGISIGLAYGHSFELGVIFFPMENRLYYATRGGGAFMNDLAIEVSSSAELSKSMVCFDNQFHLNPRSMEYYQRLTQQAFTTRILGTATNDLCMTADGTIGGRIWVNTKICDIAAGIVIVSEAGGQVTQFDGTPCTLDSKQVVASNGKIHPELLAIVNQP